MKNFTLEGKLKNGLKTEFFVWSKLLFRCIFDLSQLLIKICTSSFPSNLQKDFSSLQSRKSICQNNDRDELSKRVELSQKYSPLQIRFFSCQKFDILLPFFNAPDIFWILFFVSKYKILLTWSKAWLSIFVKGYCKYVCTWKTYLM